MSPPSSQTTSPRQGVPAPQTSSPANTILGASGAAGAKNPLQQLIMTKEASTAAAAFPKRQQEVPAPSSQATPEPPAVKREVSLSDLLPSRAKPFRSKQNTTPPSSQSLPPPQTRAKVESILKSKSAVKKTTLKDLLSSMGKPRGGNRQATTKLGGMASPEQASASAKEDRQKAMREEVVASATTPEKVDPEPTSTATAYSSLSAIIQGQNPRARPSLNSVNKERTVKTKLGEMVNSAAELGADPSPKQQSVTATTSSDTLDEVSATNAVAAGMKKQEAFQRALLSATIANDAKAKIFASVVEQTAKAESTPQLSSLSQMIQDQTKPTLSQQKAFANSNRHTSLFPEKTESHLSRLLGK